MQSKRHVTKLIKFSSKYPSWKTLEGSITATKILKVSRQTELGNEEIDLRLILVFWQNILNSRQIAVDTEEKLANQGDVLRGEIRHIYLSLSNKWKPCHRAIEEPRNFRTALEKYLRFN